MSSTLSKIISKPLAVAAVGTLGFLALPKEYKEKLSTTADKVLSFEKEYFLAESHHGLLGAGLVLTITYLARYLKNQKRLKHIYEGIHLHNVKCHYVGLGTNEKGENVLFCRPMSFAKSLDGIIPAEKDQEFLIRQALAVKENLPVINLSDPHGKMIFGDIMHVVAAENDIEASKPKEFLAFILCEDPKDKIDEYPTRLSICVITPETLAQFKDLSKVKKYRIENPEDTARVITLHNIAKTMEQDAPQHVKFQLKKDTGYTPFASHPLNGSIFELSEFFLPDFRLRIFLKS